MTLDEWQARWANDAVREGWMLFNIDSTGVAAIERLDSPDDWSCREPDDPTFLTDRAAINHITRRAAEGSAMHLHALALHTESILRGYTPR